MTIVNIAGGQGFRLVTNRDERPDRPPAGQPRWHPLAGTSHRAIWPVDGLAGGTWIAAAEQGLVLTILNGNPREPGPVPAAERRLSRGGIIPRLVGAASAMEACQGLERLELERFEPFRLVAADASDGIRIFDAFWDGARLSTVGLESGPVCFASSGLGDWRVAPRLPLFEELVVRAGATPEAQDAFHEHQWPERPEISVLMERAGARTVSTTRASVRPGGPGRFEVGMDHEARGVVGRPVGPRV